MEDKHNLSPDPWMPYEESIAYYKLRRKQERLLFSMMAYFGSDFHSMDPEIVKLRDEYGKWFNENYKD